MDDITSLTKEEENKRQQIAKEKIPQKRKRQAGSESNTEVEQERRLNTSKGNSKGEHSGCKYTSSDL